MTWCTCASNSLRRPWSEAAAVLLFCPCDTIIHIRSPAVGAGQQPLQQAFIMLHYASHAACMLSVCELRAWLGTQQWQPLRP